MLYFCVLFRVLLEDMSLRITAELIYTSLILSGSVSWSKNTRMAGSELLTPYITICWHSAIHSSCKASALSVAIDATALIIAVEIPLGSTDIIAPICNLLDRCLLCCDLDCVFPSAAPLESGIHSAKASGTLDPSKHNAVISLKALFE